MARQSTIFYCGLCGASFRSKRDLRDHEHDHEEANNSWVCDVCKWTFDDKLALEKHQIQSSHKTEPGITYDCDRCAEKPSFPTKALLVAHRKFPHLCSDALYLGKQTRVAHTLDSSESVLDYGAPIQKLAVQPSQIDMSRRLVSYDLSDSDHDTKTNGPYCGVCKRSFRSLAAYNNHFLQCTPVQGGNRLDNASASRTSTVTDIPIRTHHSASSVESGEILELESRAASIQEPKVQQPKPEILEKEVLQARPVTQMQPRKTDGIPKLANASIHRNVQTTIPSAPRQLSASVQGTSAPSVASRAATKTETASYTSSQRKYRCSDAQCHKAFDTERALQDHCSAKKHNGSKALNIHGEYSGMLDPRMRDQFQHQDLLRGQHAPLPSPAKVRNRPTSSPTHNTATHTYGRAAVPNNMRSSYHKLPQNAVAPISVPSIPRGPAPDPNITVDPEDMLQTEKLCGRIMRLALQADLKILHEGKIVYKGKKWFRIPAAKHEQVYKDCYDLCYLPEAFRSREYLPPPKAFKNDYLATYPVDDFQQSPKPSGAIVTNVIAISCDKIILSDGCQEAVKVAAIDVQSGRVLMNNLICTNPNAEVANWQTDGTGLSSFVDIEIARQEGYKIFKGWQAVRAALWTYVNQKTVIIGHNLRISFDVLRMIHGCAIDVAKLVERAAKGPIAERQLSLDSLCRDLPEINLTVDREFGRDCLLDAFAVREFILWYLKDEKHRLKLEHWAKKKALDFERVSALMRA